MLVEANQPIGLTELLVTIISLVVGFFIQNIYDRFKSREEIIYSPIIKSRFSKHDLDKKLFDMVKVNVQGQNTESVAIYELEISNVSNHNIFNQSFTVIFDEKSAIISSEFETKIEMQRFIKRDFDTTASNQVRFALGVIYKKSKILFKFIVIGHNTKNFEISHGLLDAQDKLIVSGFGISTDTQYRVIDKDNGIKNKEYAIKSFTQSLTIFLLSSWYTGMAENTYGLALNTNILFIDTYQALVLLSFVMQGASLAFFLTALRKILLLLLPKLLDSNTNQSRNIELGNVSGENVSIFTGENVYYTPKSEPEDKN